MTDFIGIPFTTWTTGSLLAFAILLIFTGRLWTNNAYQEKKEEAAYWKLAYETSEKARAISDAQTTMLLEQGKTTHAIVVAMFSTVEKMRSSGGSDVAISPK